MGKGKEYKNASASFVGFYLLRFFSISPGISTIKHFYILLFFFFCFVLRRNKRKRQIDRKKMKRTQLCRVDGTRILFCTCCYVTRVLDKRIIFPSKRKICSSIALTCCEDSDQWSLSTYIHVGTHIRWSRCTLLTAIGTITQVQSSKSDAMIRNGEKENIYREEQRTRRISSCWNFSFLCLLEILISMNDLHCKIGGNTTNNLF